MNKARLLILLWFVALGTFVSAASANASTSGALARDAATTFFGQAIPTPGTTLTNVILIPGEPGMQPKLLATSIVVTADANGVLTATAALATGNGGTINAALTWENQCHWRFNVELNSSPEATSTNATAINLDQIKGSIADEGCSRHVNLEMIGYRLGSATLDIALQAQSGGFAGSVTLAKDMVLGGSTYRTGSVVSVSTLDPHVKIAGEMSSNVGTFTVNASVNAPNGTYAVHLQVTGADLVFKTASFNVTALHFSTDATFTTGQTAQYTRTTTGGGTLVMKKTTYTLHYVTVKIVGGTVTEFRMSIHIEHQASPTEIYAGTLTLHLDGDGGTFNELTEGHSSNGPHLTSSTKPYQTALLGVLDMSKERRFSARYRGRTFSRGVTIGMIFGVSVYTVHGSSAYHAYIGAGGYFDADRVSGSFGCRFGTENMTFDCLGTLRLNPSWAGVYRAEWTI